MPILTGLSIVDVFHSMYAYVDTVGISLLVLVITVFLLYIVMNFCTSQLIWILKRVRWFFYGSLVPGEQYWYHLRAHPEQIQAELVNALERWKCSNDSEPLLYVHDSEVAAFRVIFKNNFPEWAITHQRRNNNSYVFTVKPREIVEAEQQINAHKS